MGINRAKQDAEAGKSYDGPKYLWLKDGDIAMVHVIAKDEEDTRFDSVYFHTLENIQDDGSTKRRDVPCLKLNMPEQKGECEHCNNDLRASKQFVMWTWAFYILHDKQLKQEWEEIKTPLRKFYKENISDIRLVKMKYGRSNINFNQVLDIYEAGTLNEKVIRIARKGSKLETTYLIKEDNAKVNLPAEALEKIEALPGIRDFFLKTNIKNDEKHTGETKQEVSKAAKDDDIVDDEEIF